MKKATCSRSERGTKQGDPLSSLLFNSVLQKTLKDDLLDWQKKRGMGICLGDKDHDCLTNMRFADDVLLFTSSKEQLQKMLCDFKRSTEKVGLKIHPAKTKNLSNQSSNIRKDMATDNIKVEILTRNGSTKYLGQIITFLHHETTQIKNRIRTAWVTFNKDKTRIDVKILSPSSPTSIVRRSGHTNDELRLRNMGPHKRPPKNDTVDATQNASAHHSDEKKIQKKKNKARRKKK